MSTVSSRPPSRSRSSSPSRSPQQPSGKSKTPTSSPQSQTKDRYTPSSRSPDRNPARESAAPQIKSAWEESLSSKGGSGKPAETAATATEPRRHGVHHTQESDHFIGRSSRAGGLGYRHPEGVVDIPSAWGETSVGPAIHSGDRLNLQAVTPEMISGLGPSNRRSLLDGLPDGDRNTTYRTEDANGNSTEHSRREDLATTTARRMYASGDSSAFAETFAARPESVLPWLDARSSGVLTDNMDTILSDMRATGGIIDEREQRALGSLHESYLRTHGGSDPGAIQGSMQDLLRKYTERGLTDPAGSGLGSREFAEQYGVLTGSMASGMARYMENVGFDQERASAVKWDLLEAGAGFLPGMAGSTAQALLKCAQVNETLGDRPFRAEQMPAQFMGSLQTQAREWEDNGSYPAGWNREMWAQSQRVVTETLNNNGFLVGG